MRKVRFAAVLAALALMLGTSCLDNFQRKYCHASIPLRALCILELRDTDS